MRSSSPSPTPPPPSILLSRDSDMDLPPPLSASVPTPAFVDESFPPFEWSDLLDFTFDDDQLLLSLENSIDHPNPFPLPPPPPPPPTQYTPPPTSPQPITEQVGVGPSASKRVGSSTSSSSSDRVRKRDPRMVCSNFLAGRVPCACPELDRQMEEAAEEEEGAPGKKKAKVKGKGRVVSTRGVKGRCQVVGCEADITQLKGYHRRHRVCLRCANASSVSVGGESKRYCQQCGKFHILSDFDEGKRSCRRKLERHNNRRRRKSNDPRETGDKEIYVDTVGEDGSSDGEAGTGNACSSSQNTEADMLQDPIDGNPEDKNVSNIHPMPDYSNIQRASGVISSGEMQVDGEKGSNVYPFLDSQDIQRASGVTSSGDMQVDGGRDDSKCDLSLSYCDNKSAYSSVCPTGRISFKLYDWNPAEFPRRLRLQIFQWLASMPIELEGYIRPGCTILTAFISMPQSMWTTLYEEPTAYITDFVAPGKALLGSGTALVYLNNMVFKILNDRTSVMKADVDVRIPKLHYVYPVCFEAGKPIEFIACGSNILQPKFRSLVSFAGKYLEHDYYVAFPHEKVERVASSSFDLQLCRIHAPQTDPSAFGPAFVEIENESGLSNFIPIIIGDEQVCLEIKILQQKREFSSYKIPHHASMCNPSSSFQTSSRELGLSDFLLDVAWLLKQPASEKLQQAITSSQIQRVTYLLDFLMENGCIHILQRVLESLQGVVDDLGSNNYNATHGVSCVDQTIFKASINKARNYLWQRGFSPGFSQDKTTAIVSIQDNDPRPEGTLTISECSTSLEKAETIPLLNDEVSMDVIDTKRWSRNSCHNVGLSRRVIGARPLALMAVALAVCFGICTVLLHPQQVSRIAVHVRRCLFDNS